MKLFTFIALCAIAASIADADDSPTASNQTRPSLDAKKAQLRELQDEILKLGGEIGHPTRVRITLRVVEIDCVKLKQLNLAHPFGQDKDAPLTSFGFPKADFDGDDKLLQALNPVVEQGGAEILSSASITTSVGEPVTVTSVRELPFRKVMEDHINKNSNQQDEDIAHVPGFRMEVLPVPKPEGEIALNVKYRVNIDRPNATVMLDGRVVAPVDSKAIQTSIRLKPGKVVDLGGGKSAATERIGEADGSTRVVHREVETHYLVVAELLTPSQSPPDSE
ncbi:MAG TPA: hypothetical protein VGM98_15080 [Schlesneria sp.]